MEEYYQMIANLYDTTKSRLKSTDVYEIACEMSKSLLQGVENTISDLNHLFCNGFKL